MNVRSHPGNEHANGLSPVWTRRCALRLKRLENVLRQVVNGHVYKGSRSGPSGFGVECSVAYAYATSSVWTPSCIASGCAVSLRMCQSWALVEQAAAHMVVVLSAGALVEALVYRHGC